MYHGAGYRKLGKKSVHRMAMFANMASSLIEHGRIETTLPKAKDLRRLIERLITKGKDGSLHKRRQAMSFLRSDAAVKTLFDTVAPRFKDRQGGYTRIMKLADTRYGDGASKAIIEFVDYVLPKSVTKEEKKKVKAKAKEAQKALDASRLAKPKAAKAAGVAKKTGKAGSNASMKGSGSRGT